jgi:hypothetical protein
MATATGKKARRANGLNRHQLHRANHAHKSPAKVSRAGWLRTRD